MPEDGSPLKNVSEPASNPERSSSKPRGSFEEAEKNAARKAPNDKALYDGYGATDAGNADRLVSTFEDHFRWCDELGWLTYDGARWDFDRIGRVELLAKATIRSMADWAEVATDAKEKKEALDWGETSESRARLTSMTELARSVPGISVRPEIFDRHPNLLNCQNVVVDLKDGAVYDHSPDYMMRRVAGIRYALDMETPIWDQFLKDIFNGDQDLIDFLHRALGYSITAETREQVWFLAHGAGANGKTTMLRTVAKALGEYAMYADPKTFLEQRGGGGPTPEIARLVGARLIFSTEPERGRHIAQEFVSRWTGEDKIVARHLHREPLEFQPIGKIWLAANHLPLLAAHSHAVWRRVLPIPFEVRFSDDAEEIRLGKAKPKDPDLMLELEPELPGILAKLVRGAIEWYRGGLRPPKSVTDALASYKQEMDPLADFIQSCCTLNDSSTVTVKAIYESYEGWCMASGADPLHKKGFANNFSARGIKRTNNGVRAYLGICLSPNGEEKRELLTSSRNGPTRAKRPLETYETDPYQS